MYEYIKGNIEELTPSYAIIEAYGVGYITNISLNTYSQLEGKTTVKIYVQHIVREDAELLYGFFDKNEREIFRMLCAVSGIGPNTARIILSSMTPAELQNAILSENISAVKQIKGIGLKTAQRLIIDLKDKISKTDTTSNINTKPNLSNTNREESLAALVMLGYPKAAAEKAVDAALKQNPTMSTEDLIKYALRNV